MTTIKKRDVQEMEEYYYWCGYKNWYPFPEELKIKLLRIYGAEPFPHIWTEQDIYEGSRKIILNLYENN